MFLISTHREIIPVQVVTEISHCASLSFLSSVCYVLCLLLVSLSLINLKKIQREGMHKTSLLPSFLSPSHKNTHKPHTRQQKVFSCFHCVSSVFFHVASSVSAGSHSLFLQQISFDLSQFSQC